MNENIIKNGFWNTEDFNHLNIIYGLLYVHKM